MELQLKVQKPAEKTKRKQRTNNLPPNIFRGLEVKKDTIDVLKAKGHHKR